MSAQTTEQLAMLIEDLSSELDKAHSDIADLRRLIAKIADNQLKTANVMHKLENNMKTMKTTQECWQALIDGETLTNTGGNTVRLEGGVTVDKYGQPDYWYFDMPSMWGIYTPPKWYDNIPEGGVLCHVWDTDEDYVSREVVNKYIQDPHHPFVVDDGSSYECAAPLTKQEIQVLLDNAPEGEQGGERE